MPPESNTPPVPVNHWIVPFSIIIAGALIGAGIYLSGSAPKRLANTQNQNAQIENINIKAVNSEDHIRGNPNADVVIVEFSDTECPFCKQFHNTMLRVMDEYGASGKVAWVYRQLPIDEIHSRARNEALATECSADIGGNAKFWEYLDELFKRTNSNNSLDPAELPRIAEDIGLDQKDFDECLSSKRLASEIEEDEIDAANAGARGTPHSIVITKNGEKASIKGAQPYDVIKAVIDAAIGY